MHITVPCPCGRRIRWQPDGIIIEEGTPAPSPAPRYAVGDKVRWHPQGHIMPSPEVYTVSEVCQYVTYRLGESAPWVPESELEPDSGKCAPDGTRCAWWVALGSAPASWKHCPDCGGRLR